MSVHHTEQRDTLVSAVHTEQRDITDVCTPHTEQRDITIYNKPTYINMHTIMLIIQIKNMYNIVTVI